MPMVSGSCVRFRGHCKGGSHAWAGMHVGLVISFGTVRVVRGECAAVWLVEFNLTFVCWQHVELSDI